MDRAALARNLAAVQARCAAAATAAGRNPNDVTLIAVTKYVGPEVIAALLDLDVIELGESRPQRLWELAPQFPQARWHLIGHWQTNKLRRTLPFVAACHSLDRLDLAAALSAELVRAGRTLDCFVEANVANAAQKHGFAPAELPALLPRLADLPGLRLAGLMAMAEPAGALATFFEARHLSEQLRADEPRLGPGLSMGMSGDFEDAIRAGATQVRVGSALFEGVAP